MPPFSTPGHHHHDDHGHDDDAPWDHVRVPRARDVYARDHPRVSQCANHHDDPRVHGRDDHDRDLSLYDHNSARYACARDDRDLSLYDHNSARYACARDDRDLSLYDHNSAQYACARDDHGSLWHRECPCDRGRADSAPCAHAHVHHDDVHDADDVQHVPYRHVRDPQYILHHHDNERVVQSYPRCAFLLRT